MGIVIRQSAKNFIVSILGALLGAFVIWLSTKYLTKQQFGFTRNFTNYAVTISQIIILGLNSVLVVYVHRFVNNPNKSKLLVTLCLLLPLVICSVSGVFYLLLRSRIIMHFQPSDRPFMQEYFNWLPVFMAFFTYMLILEQYLGSQMKVAISAFMREVVLRIANIVLILLFAFGYISFHQFVIYTILIYILPVSIFFFLAGKTKPFGFSLRLSHFTKSEYIEMLKFSWFHFLMSMSMALISYLDALALPFYDHKGFSSVAIYGVAVFLISFLQIPLKALMPASFTVLAQAFAEENYKKAKDVFIRSSVNVLIPSIFLALILCCNIGNIIAVVKNGYSEIAPVFFILVIGRLFDIATGMNDQVLSIANYYKFNFYLSLILCVFLFAMIRILVPLYGIYGAAWSTTVTTIAFNIVKYIFIAKKLHMQPFSKNTMLIIMCGLPALAAGYFFPYFFNPSRHVYVHAFIDAGLRSIVIGIVYAAMILWLKPSKDLEEYIAAVKKNKRLF